MEKLWLQESVMGILAFDEHNTLVDKSLFPKKPEKAAEKVALIEKGELTEEVEKLVTRLKARCQIFVLENKALAESIHAKLGVAVEVEKPTRAGEYLRSNIDTLAIQVGFAKKQEAFRETLRQISTLLTRTKVKAKAAKRDKVLIQVINAIDELDKTLNLHAGRITEWYGLHFPEMEKILESHEAYVRLIDTLGEKENFQPEALTNLGISKPKAENLMKAAAASLGAPMDPNDVESLKSLCKLYLQMARERNHLLEALENLMGTVAPNLKSMVGTTLGGRLIALGGGMDRLATLPASTFQVLGAEKALFRSLKTGANPPKHGVIFQHQLVHQAPRWQRGKISRAIAGKIAIAARIDAFSGGDKSAMLKAELERRVKEIRAKYPKPPVREGVRKKPQRWFKRKER